MSPITSYRYIKIENKGALRKIILNNPAKKNSLNTQAYQELTGNHRLEQFTVAQHL